MSTHDPAAIERVASARYHDAVCQKRAARKRSEAKRKASA